MKVILNVSRAGVGFVQNPGDEIDVCEKEAKALIESGYAAPVKAGKREKATKKVKVEKATLDA